MKLELNDKRVLVLGLGDTGVSALRWLTGQGALLSAADTRSAPPGMATVQAEFPEIALHLGPFKTETLAQAEIIVASPGVALNLPAIQAAVEQGIPLVGDVELFAQYKPGQAKVIAITGSNGKSTVTTLVGDMCRAAGFNTIVAGNIGLPVLDALALPAPDVYVLELSSFQLESTISLNADAATVLNVTEDHMDRYVGMTDYAETKSRIFKGHGIQILNREDHFSFAMTRPNRHEHTFGTDQPPTQNDFGLLHRDGRVWLAQGSTALLDLSELCIPGLHNAANALAALALCDAIGLDHAPLLKALREFKGLPHRVQRVAQINSVSFYDDSKGTNVGATCAALAGMPCKVVLIAGGDAKGQDFLPLREPVRHNARAVVLIGRDAGMLRAALTEANIPLIDAVTMEQAVQLAYQAAQPGDAVLLSPACASFDMFKNYVQRAEVFTAAVNALEVTA